MVLQEIHQIGEDSAYSLGLDRFLLNDLGKYKTAQVLLATEEGLRSRTAYYQAKYPDRLYIIVKW